MRAAVIMMAGAVAVAAWPGAAEVKAADTGGFLVASTVLIAAPPEKVWAALVEPARWWDAEHGWSKDGANIRLDPVVGGCFCEAIPATKGEVEHLRVIFVMPGQVLRLRGALGPFQTMGVSGALEWTIKPVDGGTQLNQSYAIGGFIPGGGASLAAVVDQVMSGQLNRLKAFVEKK
ncbi:SRPBCC family protein [Sphingomonas sp. SRS2]|uniref:SRPBCC family protein n=1 Tax=Sphingomonas sp. SRS2 TaxID=133190 RepID=UPI0006184AA1|nr:SRPBCC domain-containing protein [Sphingomonas sp. SRS2]KKC24600.1 activator of HSP90 ATPase [Sphingomonas sp. SRS2]